VGTTQNQVKTYATPICKAITVVECDDMVSCFATSVITCKSLQQK